MLRGELNIEVEVSFFLVNKSRVLAKVIYVHTEVLGYVPNSAPLSIGMNSLGINQTNKYTLLVEVKAIRILFGYIST